MTRSEAMLLAALRSAVNGAELSSDPALTAAEWADVLRLAREHEILPLVLEAVYRLPSFKALEKDLVRSYRDSAVQSAIRQIVQENEFLTLLLHAQSRGLDPIVLKGVVCRSLYPKPMLRPSVDEDILVPASQAGVYNGFFLEEGLSPDDPEADPDAAGELSYHKSNSPTYIELHTAFFPADSAAYGDLNALFDGAMDRTVRVQIQDVSMRTLAPTDHMLYLLCHAYKHFLHAGVGIRQVYDMGMMARAYGSEIDWKTVAGKCRSVRIDRFAAGLFRIGEKHLGFSMPAAFAGLDVDETALLEDILSGGLYGVNDIDRAHSATITLDAVAAEKQGRRSRGLLAAAFPGVSSLAGRYPYLKKRPWLLPAAWGQRIWTYLSHRDVRPDTDPAQSVRIGRERTRLLREYGIID